MPFLNRTPFAQMDFPYLSMAGDWITICLLKATIRFSDGSAGVVEIKPGEFIFEDEYAGDPSNSSLVLENDLAPWKPNADVYLADAVTYSPLGIPRSEWTASLQVGSMRKTVVVKGDRSWRRRPLAGWCLDAPTPTTSRRLWYEDAFGGTWEGRDGQLDAYDQNPVGLGFVQGTLAGYCEMPAPSIETRSTPIAGFDRTYPVAGLGAVARSWQPRLALAGTFDDGWENERWPLWPEDLDCRFFNAAPADQQYPGYLRGNETVCLENLTESGSCDFRLPFDREPYALAIDQEQHVVHGSFRLDTLVICPEDKEAHVTWRLALPMANPAAVEIQMV